MQFTTTQDFPAGLDQLWAAFGHPEYPRQKYLALGATAVRVHRFQATSRSIDVDLERVVPVLKFRLPGWTHRLLGSKQTVRHRTTWRRIGATQIAAELDIAPIGFPVRAHGIGDLVEVAPQTTRMALTWHVDSSVPLMRANVERLFADQVRAALDDDHRFTVDYLRRVRPKRPGS